MVSYITFSNGETSQPTSPSTSGPSQQKAESPFHLTLDTLRHLASQAEALSASTIYHFHFSSIYGD